MMAYRSKYKK